MKEKRGGGGNHRKPKVKSDRQALRDLHAAEKKRARQAKKGLVAKKGPAAKPEKQSKRAKEREPAKRGRVPEAPTRERQAAVEPRPLQTRSAQPPARKSRRRIRPILWLLCVLALAGLLWGLYYGTSLFHVRDIEVTGCSHLNPDYIRALSGIDRETRFFGVNAGDVEKALKSEFWVESVSIKRKLPLKILIQVKEREPWASVTMVGRIFSVDVHGVILEELAVQDPSLPTVLDLPPRAVTPGDSVQGEQFQACVDVLLSMPGELQGRFLSVGSSPKGEVTLTTQEGMQIIYGTAGGQQTKNEAIKALLQDPGVDIAGLAYLDVSVADHPVIKPR